MLKINYGKNLGFNIFFPWQYVDIVDFLAIKWEPIPQFTNAAGLFIHEFKIRGLLLERIYRELRGPPVLYFDFDF